jgi:hypothetical protein
MNEVLPVFYLTRALYVHAIIISMFRPSLSLSSLIFARMVRSPAITLRYQTRLKSLAWDEQSGLAFRLDYGLKG